MAQTPPPQTEKVKLIVLGASGVGKTSIISAFMYGQFSKEYETTIGVDYYTKTITAKGKSVGLQIWDTAGQEQFHALTPNYIRDAMVVLFVYDVSDSKTLDGAHYWYDKVVELRGHEPVFYLVGNKTDLGSNADQDAVLRLSKEGNMKTFTTSAKTLDGITQLFNSVAEVALTKTKKEETKTVVVTPTENQTEQTGGCSC